MDAKFVKKRCFQNVGIRWFILKLGGCSRWSSKEICCGSGKIQHFKAWLGWWTVSNLQMGETTSRLDFGQDSNSEWSWPWGECSKRTVGRSIQTNAKISKVAGLISRGDMAPRKWPGSCSTEDLGVNMEHKVSTSQCHSVSSFGPSTSNKMWGNWRKPGWKRALRITAYKGRLKKLVI